VIADTSSADRCQDGPWKASSGLHHVIRNHCHGSIESMNNTLGPLDPKSILISSANTHLCFASRKLVAYGTHMMLFHCLQTLTPHRGTSTVHPAFVQCIVQSHPREKLPGETIHPGVAQAVLPSIRIQLATRGPDRFDM
jgi:hypothetical protein